MLVPAGLAEPGSPIFFWYLYREMPTMNLEKTYRLPLLIDLLISNNFSFMTFFCVTRILQVIGCQSYKVYVYTTILDT